MTLHVLQTCSICGTPCAGLRCDLHADTESKRRRGYDAEYERNRRELLADATKCECCGGLPTERDPLTAGHIIALELGGTNERRNLRAELRSCNSRAGQLLAGRREFWGFW
jgi:5-methylcytosine-specific restriction endonuclease McrA